MRESQAEFVTQVADTGITPSYPSSFVMRTAPLKKMRRLRVIWFLLGALAGGIASYAAAMALHAQEFSKRNNIVFNYAQLDYNKQAIARIVAPPTHATPIPSAQSAVNVLSAPALKAESAPHPSTSVAVPSVLPPGHVNVKVRRGDTLDSMLMAQGVSHDEAYNVSRSMRKIYNPRNLTIGQSVELGLDKNKSTKTKINSLSIAVSPLRTVAMARTQNNSFAVRDIKTPVSKSLTRGGGLIRSSLYQTGVDSGVPPQMLNEIINAFSYDVDFQRDIQEGDKLDVVYERIHTDKNVTAGYGNVIYASLILNGRELSIYRHVSADGYSGFYTATGESVKKALLRTPVNGAHITSGFGMRLHPLLGYSRMHKGVDFGAPTGTPIYAAGDGVVVIAGRHAGYGNYVRLKHNNHYETAYGHASRLARGIHPGAHVKQGQVIAYVGSTGMATGPHLHYEILVNGAQVNPSGVKFRTGQVLQGRELAQFRGQVRQLQGSLAAIPRITQVASLK